MSQQLVLLFVECYYSEIIDVSVFPCMCLSIYKCLFSTLKTDIKMWVRAGLASSWAQFIQGIQRHVAYVSAQGYQRVESVCLCWHVVFCIMCSYYSCFRNSSSAPVCSATLISLFLRDSQILFSGAFIEKPRLVHLLNIFDQTLLIHFIISLQKQKCPKV